MGGSTPPPDADVLAGWLAGAGVAFTGSLGVRLIAGGRSNLTYLLSDAEDRTLVLRRPPGGELLDSAHDMHREWRFISALRPTDVPVPDPLVYCDDPAVIGAPFYVMGFVDGVVVETHEGAQKIPEEHQRIIDEQRKNTKSLEDDDWGSTKSK